MKLKEIIKIIYFLILQISSGFMFWILYSISDTFQTLLYKFIILIIFIVGIAFPNFYISENLFKNTRNILLTILQVGILVITYNLLLNNIGTPVIIFK